jgi:hypothetical protein
MSTDQGPDLRPSYLQHRAMRVDAARLPDLVAAAQPSDADRLVGLAAWYTRFEQAIHDHHSAEEAVVYPALLERDPSFAAADAELEGQHEVARRPARGRPGKPARSRGRVGQAQLGTGARRRRRRDPRTARDHHRSPRP